MIRTWGILVGLALGVALVAPRSAFAQGERPWTLSVDLGSEGNLTGNLIDGSTGVLAGQVATTTPESWKEFYNRGLHWGVGIGYNTSTTSEIRVRASYTKWNSSMSRLGSVGSSALMAEFDEYQAFGIDAGFRVYFASWESRVRPFLGSSLGFTRISEIGGSMTGSGVNMRNVPFWNATTSPTFGAELGLMVTVSPNVAIHGGLNLRWHTDLNDEDGLSGTGLEGLNDKTAQWTMPVFAGLTIRF